MNPFHTPEEMILFSNMAHWFEGGLLALVVMVGLFQAMGLLKIKTAQLAWSILILIAGSFLVPYILLHHGLDKVGDTWRFIMQDPQQLQHLIMGILLMVAGLAELLNALNILKAKIWKFVFPTILAIIGIMFIIHNQHGTANSIHQSVIFHRYLGTALILTGIAKAAEVIWRESYRWIAYPWLILMLVTSGMLITYREPEGVYQEGAIPQMQQNKPNPHHQ